MVVRTCFLIGLSALLLHAPVFGQSVGTLSGQVTDETGGTLPGVTVQVTNEDTGISRSELTDGEGRYRSRNLGLGRYRVEATLAGFQTVVRSGIMLNIDREALVDIKLAVGEIAEQITVEGDAPLVEMRSSGMTSLVAREQLADLPLNARDYSQLIAIQPGTTFYRTQRGSPTSGYGARISVSGARVTSNVFTLDGTDIQTSSGLLPSGVTGATLGLEAVQEFKVLTSNYSAQYGRSAGATVMAATRSGTNQFRGSGYWYVRNDNLDTRNFFDVLKPEFSRNQMGASIGGRIVKDRTFFFTNYEVLREKLPVNLIGRVPTAAARQGILPGRTVVVDPAVVPYLDLWPLPTGRDFGDGTAEFQYGAEQPTDQDYLSARVDHQFNTNHSMFVRYTIDDSEVIESRSVPLYQTFRATRQQYGTLEQRSVLSSRLLNQVRIGLTRDLMDADNIDVNPPDPSLSFVEGRRFGLISVTGISTLEGYSGDAPNKRIVNSAQLHDDVSFDFGRHSFRFGGSATGFQYDRIQLSREGGDFEFGSLVDFLQNRPPTRLRIMGADAVGGVTFNQWLTALYLQDDIKLGPRLTLNAGMRYEYVTVPTERHGRVANVRTIFDREPTVGDPLYESPGGFFSPRIGLAWDPTGTGRLSVRSGFGVFHEPLVLKYYLNSLARIPPFWREADPARADLAGLFPNLTPHLERISQGPQAIHAFPFEPNNPYVMQWNLSVQQMLAANLVAEVAYSGARGVHLGGRKDYAIPIPQDVNGDSYYAPELTQILNPSFSRLEWYDTSASSAYHALKVNVAKRYSSGLHFQAAYTWAKAMDTQSATLGGELGSATLMDSWDPRRDWGVADFHVAHVFSGNFSYELPWGTNTTGLTAALVTGWQLSGILSATTGTPFTVSSQPTLTHPLVRGGASRPDLIPGGNNNPVLGGPDAYFDPNQFVPQKTGFYGTLGRNTLLGPGLAQVDASAIKNLPIGGTRKIQFRAEVFNLLNRANFGLPARSLFNTRGERVGGVGRITSTATSARQIQLALRFEF